MATSDSSRPPSRRAIFEASDSGAQERPWLPRLRSDPPPFHPLARSLVDFRRQEGQEERERRLRKLWTRLPKRPPEEDVDDEAIAKAYPVTHDGELTKESAKQLVKMYEDELFGRCREHTYSLRNRSVSWDDFRKYAEAKEAGMFLYCN